MKFLALPAFLAVALTGADHKPQTLDEALAEVTGEVVRPLDTTEAVEPVAKPIEKVWTGKGFSENEAKALEFLQKRGIRDRAALSVVLGNIKQESMFVTNICEGGARGPYETCRSGGFGLIQWTTLNRYQGLGNFCKNYDLDPNSIEGQLRYMVNEVQWVRYEPYLKGEGQSIDYYMKHAYAWLGWGIHGARTQYAHSYYNNLVLS
jgi:hypothetical protein